MTGSALSVTLRFKLRVGESELAVESTVPEGEVALLTPGGLRCSAQVSPQGLRAGEQVTLGIRPEHVRLGHGTQRARVGHVERLGEHSLVYLDLPGAAAPLLAKSPREDLRAGDELQVELPAETLHLFRADGQALARAAAQPQGND